MNHPAPMPDDVSALQDSLDRAYWTSLLTNATRPGLGLMATRFRGGLPAARDAAAPIVRERLAETGPLHPTPR